MYGGWYCVETGEPLYLTFGRAGGLGVTAGAVLLFGQSLLPDTMEWDYRRTGMRREGMLSAVYTIVEKLAYRSEEHTSELQSLMRISYAVFCLKKKNRSISKQIINNELQIECTVLL